MTLEDGTQFAGFTIVRLLGSGGMGEVYLAEHPRLPRRDALKVLSGPISADVEYRQRFIQEADLAARLFHPDIVRVNDRGECDGQLWIAMDYVEGSDLGSLIRTRYPAGMPVEEVLAVTDSVSSALDYAHDQGVLHRDVKPANILVGDVDRGSRRILLSDFGIAREIGAVSGLTATNLTVGTSAYGAPEQLMGQPVDGRADQYALAATVFTLLTGALPYERSNPVAVIGAHLNAAPPSVGALRPELAAVDAVVARGMAKDPADRFPTCGAFAAALRQAALPGSSSAQGLTMVAPIPNVEKPDPTADGRARPGRKRRAALVATGLAVIAAIIATATILHRVGASDPVVAGPTLDGTYRLTYDAEIDVNGLESSGEPSERLWAFRSVCRKSGCTATGTELDTANPTVARPNGLEAVLHFVDGHWVSDKIATRTSADNCVDDTGAVTTRTYSRVTTYSLAPSPNGTLQGTQTTTTLTNQCASQGYVLVVRFRAGRTGEVPGTVTVQDPGSISSAVSPETSTTSPGPTPEGLYRISFDTTRVKVTGISNFGQVTSSDQLWAFRGACSSPTNCIATMSSYKDDAQRTPAGWGLVFRYSTGGWSTVSPYLEDKRITCNSPPQNPTSTTYSLDADPQNGGFSGTQTVVFLTSACGGPGQFVVPFTATRIGDNPTDAVIADPSLFLS